MKVRKMILLSSVLVFLLSSCGTSDATAEESGLKKYS
jgi:hypothetical protein